MNKGTLIQAINEFIEDEDDTREEEAYGTDKDEAERVMERFKRFLIKRNIL